MAKEKSKPIKLDRKVLPAGLGPADFTYSGRPARDQGDFGPEVGVADMACVNQFGAADNSKHYHAGVVRAADGQWFVYLEWGRIRPGKSWQSGAFGGQDYQFVKCPLGESEARDFFKRQCESKNLKRLEEKTIGGKKLWAALDSEDGYIVQRLATRERGLPDAYGIKDASGVAPPKPALAATDESAEPTVTAPAAHQPQVVAPHHPQVIALAKALTGGTVTFARERAAEAGGVIPTKDAIDEVRDSLIPLALTQIARIGDDVHKQVADSKLVDISKLVRAMIPMPIPRTKDPFERARAAILNADTILGLQADLDAFEAALKSENFDVIAEKTREEFNPDRALNAKVGWLEPSSPIGRWVTDTFNRMTNNRHHYRPRVLNVFAIERPDRDAQFNAAVKRVGALRQGRFALKANLQPAARPDVAIYGDEYWRANVITSWHGTRSVNVSPIVQTHFRLPKQLSGVVISGANFGHGSYYAVDVKKSIGYTSAEGSYWSGGGGGIKNRGAFMFLCDMIMGDAFRAPSTGSWTSPPGGKDSIFGVGGDRGHSLQNDEHVVFAPEHARIRYLVEFTT